MVKGMKKVSKGDFKDRYGDDAQAVMYATAQRWQRKTHSSKIIYIPISSISTTYE